MSDRWFVAAALAVLTAAAPASAYESVPVVDGGTITGRVVYRGEAPPQAPIAVIKDVEVCGREKPPPGLVVGPGNGIRNAVIRLLDVRRGKPMPPPRRIRFRQRGCEYAPHVLLFPAGSRIQIENADGILHHTNLEAETNPSFSVAQPKFRRIVEKRIEEPEMAMRIRCDVHSWMSAWWISQEHPYYTRSDAAGAFHLDEIPPGDYTLEVWHERLGTITRNLTVPPNGTVRLSLEMPPTIGRPLE